MSKFSGGSYPKDLALRGERDEQTIAEIFDLAHSNAVNDHPDATTEQRMEAHARVFEDLKPVERGASFPQKPDLQKLKS